MNRLRKGWLLLVSLLVAHIMLLTLCAETGVVSVLFAPGPDVPVLEIMLALAFIGVRLAVYGLGPPLAAWLMYRTVSVQRSAELPARSHP